MTWKRRQCITFRVLTIHKRANTQRKFCGETRKTIKYCCMLDRLFLNRTTQFRDLSVKSKNRTFISHESQKIIRLKRVRTLVYGTLNLFTFMTFWSHLHLFSRDWFFCDFPARMQKNTTHEKKIPRQIMRNFIHSLEIYLIFIYYLLPGKFREINFLTYFREHLMPN